MAAQLTSSRLLASFIWQIDNRVTFSYGDEADPDFFLMDADKWLDMGKPETITITVEPGDLLNG
jgi:hypothetical protein